MNGGRPGGAEGHDPGKKPRAQVGKNALLNSAISFSFFFLLQEAVNRWLTAVILFLSIFFIHSHL